MWKVYAYGIDENDDDSFCISRHRSFYEASKIALSIYGEDLTFIRAGDARETQLVLDHVARFQEMTGHIGRGWAE